tara:strand:- start:378 stop:1082 length:705 start_codon:yes stop_codon:yes gene_type:complete
MDYLPEVKMDFIPSDEDENEEDNINIEIEDFDEEKDISQEEIQKKQDQVEDIVPKAKSKREDMKVEEIFNMPNNGVIINDPNVKLTKKGKPRKPRPPMTEAHKEKLKLAREKAMASRKKKAQEKKEAKALEKEEKELLKKQKVKRVQKLKEEVEEDIKPQPLKELVKEPTFTKKDLEDAQLQAIMNYEKIRKSRKEQKRIEQEKNKEQEALKAQIRRAVAPPKQEYNNPFAGCY